MLAWLNTHYTTFAQMVDLHDSEVCCVVLQPVSHYYRCPIIPSATLVYLILLMTVHMTSQSSERDSEETACQIAFGTQKIIQFSHV